MSKIILPIVVGPTASGKTKLGVYLAKQNNGEVVSCDSMQIYKGMDIATAKPTIEEMQGVPHHLISIIEPDVRFSVAEYKPLADKTILDINSRGKMPIMVGGTGLYADTVADNITFSETKTDFELREKLQSIATEKGNTYMHDWLKRIDPITADELHENNLGRIIRAIEVYEQTGIPISEHKKNSRLIDSPYKPIYIGLDFEDRQVLYDRINQRVDEMVEMGLLEEAKIAYESHNDLSTSSQAIGYKELIPYFKGESSFEECIEVIKLKTRQYAKRQLTWFRRNNRINRIFVDKCDNFNNLLDIAQKYIEK